jgi:hypothetical protein
MTLPRVRAHKFVPEAPFIDVTFKRELTNFVLVTPLIDVTSKRELTSFVSEAPFIDGASKRAHSFCFRGPTHW